MLIFFSCRARRVKWHVFLCLPVYFLHQCKLLLLYEQAHEPEADPVSQIPLHGTLSPNCLGGLPLLLAGLCSHSSCS